MKVLKLLFITIALGFALSSCDKDYNVAERNVFSEDGSIQLEEIFLLMNVKTSDSTWLVTESIDSITLYVNSSYWAMVSSESVNVAGIPSQEVGNMNVSNSKLEYLVLAEQDIEEPEYLTAGDFAQFLNSYYVLEPGEYACLIESFVVTYNDNTREKFYPMQYTTFSVEEGSRSVFVGEFEINIEK
jgi:hypothetical protein